MDKVKEWHDWYDVLRIPAAASSQEIQQAFRKAMLDEHADTSKHPNAHERAILITMAGDALRDSNAKAKFDCERKERSDNQWQLTDARNQLAKEKRLREQNKLIAEVALTKANQFLSSLQEAEQRAEKAEADAKRLRSSLQKAEQRAAKADANWLLSSLQEAENTKIALAEFGNDMFEACEELKYRLYLAESHIFGRIP